MSEPKLISPLLDGYAVGAPISSRQGAVCCPAMKRGSNDRYIVKIISVPASAKQYDALLLAGAYSDSGQAAAYFKEQSDRISAEADILRKLSAGTGFSSYINWQVVPFGDNRPGFQVYLLGTFKLSLDRQFRKGAVGSQNAVELGRMLCDALSSCRKAGYIYAALKPTNIYVNESQGYSIGDLGFIQLDSLGYMPLPGKCCSAYTPPEMQDAMHTLDGTVYTYALGMILYQLCNHGQLPTVSDSFIAPPAEAEASLSQVIMKAISPDPSQRWKDPDDMAQALAACKSAAGSDTSSHETQVFSAETVNSVFAASSASRPSGSMSDTRVIPAPGKTEST